MSCVFICKHQKQGNGIEQKYIIVPFTAGQNSSIVSKCVVYGFIDVSTDSAAVRSDGADAQADLATLYKYDVSHL